MVIPVAALGGILNAASNIANVIQVGILVNDSLSPTLNAYEAQLDTLDGKTASWLAGFSVPIPGSILDGVKSAADYIKSSIFDAAQQQTSMIATASALSTNLKIPIDDAYKVVENSQIAIANIAAALPGATSGYADIYRSLAGTLSKQFSGDDFKQQTEAFTKRVGILAAISGADASMSGNAANRLLAGRSGVGEAMVQDIFQRNDALSTALFAEMDKEKVAPDDWKKIKQEVRTRIFSNALAFAAPDSLINAFEGTFQGTYETIKTQLFDPISGLLGVLRKVGTQEGMTVLDAVNNIFQSLNNIKDRIVEVLQSMGVNFDPFHYLIEVFKFINESIGFLVAAVISNDPFKNIYEFISTAPDTIAGWITSTIDFVANLIDRLLNSGVSGEEVGSVIGNIMNIFEKIKDKVLDNVDVKQIAELYFKVSKEIADLQTAIWWESVKIIPTRIGNWFSEAWLNISIGFQPVRVAFVRFVEFLTKIIDGLVELGKTLINPIGAIADVGNNAVGWTSNDIGVKIPDSAPLRQQAAATTSNILKGIINPASTVTELGTKALLDLVRPKQPNKNNSTTNNNNKRTAFAPVINVNGTSSADTQQLASMVMDEIIAAYGTFTDNVLV